MKRIGIDIDGVLAQFCTGFDARIKRVTGRNLFPTNYVPLTWNYPTALGYTDQEISTVWDDIKSDRVFWLSLFPYPDTAQSLARLSALQRFQGHEVYFITARPGLDAKKQTEQWLTPFLSNGFGNGIPTVLISGQKGAVCRALGLDVYLDDRWENALDVAENSDATSYLLTRPWNTEYRVWPHGILRVESIAEFLELAAA